MYKISYHFLDGISKASPMLGKLTLRISKNYLFQQANDQIVIIDNE